MIDFYARENGIDRKCPMCGTQTWSVMKCHSCGRIFCRYCKPEAFVPVDECPEDEMVTCDCGDELLLIDW